VKAIAVRKMPNYLLGREPSLRVNRCSAIVAAAS